jgi:hypothetical protein
MACRTGRIEGRSLGDGSSAKVLARSPCSVPGFLKPARPPTSRMAPAILAYRGVSIEPGAQRVRR